MSQETGRYEHVPLPRMVTQTGTEILWDVEIKANTRLTVINKIRKILRKMLDFAKLTGTRSEIS